MTLRLTEDQARVIIDRINRTASRPAQAVPPAPAAAKKRKGTKRGPSELELLIAQQITILEFPNPEREFKHIPGREFRLDFAWPDLHLGLEVQGMVHRIKGRFKADSEKRALGLIHGWRVLEVTGDDIRSGRAAAWLTTLLEKKNERRPGPDLAR